MQEHTAEQQQTDLPRRLARFVLAVTILMFTVYVLAPLPIKYIPAMAHYAKGVDLNDINTGSLFYTDVPVSVMAEQNSRNTVRFYYQMPKERKATEHN
ncbi:hypothetical protein LJB93_02410 [Desulfovibrio sp. OttesenSCG-928-F07]|nr:hypothetical protein [Desulfovibrio sp. OttesenSCG-928-F07]